MANLTRLSKFLALILRHKATEFDIQAEHFLVKALPPAYIEFP